MGRSTRHNDDVACIDECDDRIRVSVRFRPPNKKEIASDGEHGEVVRMCCGINADGRSCQVTDAYRGKVTPFTFDAVLGPSASQDQTFHRIAAPLVDAALSGLNTACIAYGQTGSGKTHTMFGPGFDISPESRQQKAQWMCQPSEYGIVPRLLDSLFARLHMKCDDIESEVECAFVQIYNEQVTDLITCLRLRVQQNPFGSFQHNGLFTPVGSTEDLLALVREGLMNRVTAKTGANATSSRSHAILSIRLVQRELDTGITRMSSIDLVDLAGSEKVAKTGAFGTRLREAQHINKSLFSLSKVIEQLSTADQPKDAFVPYRNSVLTKLLKDKLSGNAVTSILVCASSHPYNVSETLSSLSFGARAKYIETSPVENIQETAEELRMAISRLSKTCCRQRRTMRHLQSDVAIHKKLVQQVISRIPEDSSILHDIYAVLPSLSLLPRMGVWNSVFSIPKWVMFSIFEYTGVGGILSSTLVCKDWHNILSDLDWDTRLWRRMLHREARSIYPERIWKSLRPCDAQHAAGEETKDGESKGESDKSPKKANKLSWRKACHKWYHSSAEKRLAEILNKCKSREKDRLGGLGHVILLR
eukprot:g3249.t1